MQPTLLNIFIKSPGKWWTAKKLKEELKNEFTNDYHFRKVFLELRENFIQDNRRIVKFKMFGKWQYVLTDNPRSIERHNKQLQKEINKRIKRKIA